MSPIVYVPPKPHDCEPPRRGEEVDYPDGGGGPPEGTIWECEKCARRWELQYLFRVGETYTPFGRRKKYYYYTINWRRAYY